MTTAILVAVSDAHCAKKGRLKCLTLSLRSESNASGLAVPYLYAILSQVVQECFKVVMTRQLMCTAGLQYETNSEDVRRMFEEHGDIKTFFDLISTRGMVFVTYVSVLGCESRHIIYS
jgi:hypothetical protein